MSITATVEPDAAPPRVRIDTTGEVVHRVDATGVATPVRGIPEAGVLYDYECPQETPVTYTTTVPGTATVEATTPVEIPNAGDWLVHLGTPELSQQITLGAHPGWTDPSQRFLADVPGGPTIAVNFGRNNARGTLRLNTYTREDKNGLRALLADGSTLFLSTHEEVDLGPCYVSFGDADWTRRQNWTGDQARYVTLPYVEVDRPEIVASTSVTIDDLTGTIDSLGAGTVDELGT